MSNLLYFTGVVLYLEINSVAVRMIIGQNSLIIHVVEKCRKKDFNMEVPGVTMV